MLRYRLRFEPDDNDTVLVTSPDLPIATFGATQAEAHRNAADAIDLVVESMMSARQDVPLPTVESEVAVPYHGVSLQTEMKIRLHQAMLSAGMTRADLARALGWKREAVDRLFRLDHNSRIAQIERAFEVLGRAVSIQVLEAA